MTYYKVVSFEDGKLFSFMKDSPVTLEYFPGDWVEGELGPLFVFETLKAASHFLAHSYTSGDTQVWECECEMEAQSHGMILCLEELYNELGEVETSFRKVVREFWRRVYRGEAPYMDIPKGTKLFYKVKLLKKVERIA